MAPKGFFTRDLLCNSAEAGHELSLFMAIIDKLAWK